MAAEVLITGSRGNLSCEFAKELERRSTNFVNLSLRDLGKVDLHQKISFLKPRIVIHAAGVTFGSSASDFEPNILMAADILEVCQSLPLNERPILLVLGSAAELGDPGPEAAPEERIANPISHYGRSKYLQTKMFLDAQSSYGQRIVVARVFNVSIFSNDGPTILQRWFDIAKEIGSDPVDLETGDLSIVRDFLSGPWVAYLISELVFNSNARGLVNIGSGRALSLRNAMGIVEKKLGRSFIAHHNPSFDRQGTPRFVVADVSRLRGHLNQELSQKLDALEDSELLFGRPQ
jgi:nucleoside-diphosphate-sugar epimerase